MQNDTSVIFLTADLGFGAFDCFEKFRNKQYELIDIEKAVAHVEPQWYQRLNHGGTMPKATSTTIAWQV